jgi:hypothetical protein
MDLGLALQGALMATIALRLLMPLSLKNLNFSQSVSQSVSQSMLCVASLLREASF